MNRIPLILRNAYFPSSVWRTNPCSCLSNPALKLGHMGPGSCIIKRVLRVKSWGRGSGDPDAIFCNAGGCGILRSPRAYWSENQIAVCCVSPARSHTITRKYPPSRMKNLPGFLEGPPSVQQKRPGAQSGGGGSLRFDAPLLGRPKSPVYYAPTVSFLRSPPLSSKPPPTRRI